MAEEMAEHKRRLTEIQADLEAQTLEREQKLNEKIAHYRTALEGSDPERAAQLVALDQQIQDNQQAAAEARLAIQALQDKGAVVEEQLAAAHQLIAERDKALSETEQKLKDARAAVALEQSALTALQREHDASVAASSEALAKLREQLEAAEAAHEKAKAQTAAAVQAAKEAHAAQMAKAEGRISELTRRLTVETAAREAFQEKHDAMVEELRGSLAAAEQNLAGVETELREARQAADEARQTHEQQIAEAQSTISGLEQTLEQTRQKAAEDLAASEREGEEAVAYVRGIYSELSTLGGRHTKRGVLLSLAENDLQFSISKAKLPEGEIPSLDRIAELLVGHPELMIRIEGHTDNKGRDETNLELSQKRADAVKQALAERGVDLQRMAAKGIGAARPIADNASSAGRRKNRRVEIYVLENQDTGG